MKMEEYIKILLEQIRFKKAHKAIEEEIRSHIEEQIEDNISEGMDIETAKEAAVKDMGDPVEAGVALDKVHRPRIAWGVVLFALFIGLAGVLINILLSKVPTAESCVVITGSGQELDAGKLYVRYIIPGIAVMLLLYFVDYTAVVKYSEIAATIILGAYVLTECIITKGYIVARTVKEAGYYSGLSEVDKMLLSSLSWIRPLLFLMIPLYAGIIYKNRGQGYRALIKSFLWLFVLGILECAIEFYYGYSIKVSVIMIVLCMLCEFTIAILKEWIKVPKIPVLVFVWSLFTAVPIILACIIDKLKLLDISRRDTIRRLYNQNSDMDRTKEIVEGMSLFGSGSIKSFGGKIQTSTDLFVRKSIYGEYVLTDIMAVWGKVAVWATIAVVAILIVMGLVYLSKTKNQLGQVMGCGCIMWLALNVIINMCVGFGILPPYYNRTFFPFISNGKLVASYAFLGILLSIYKYKDAYTRHVDIRINGSEKKFEVKRRKLLDKELS